MTTPVFKSLTNMVGVCLASQVTDVCHRSSARHKIYSYTHTLLLTKSVWKQSFCFTKRDGKFELEDTNGLIRPSIEEAVKCLLFGIFKNRL